VRNTGLGHQRPGFKYVSASIGMGCVSCAVPHLIIISVVMGEKQHNNLHSFTTDSCAADHTVRGHEVSWVQNDTTDCATDDGLPYSVHIQYRELHIRKYEHLSTLLLSLNGLNVHQHQLVYTYGRGCQVRLLAQAIKDSQRDATQTEQLVCNKC
jgi:hypothetical protein